MVIEIRIVVIFWGKDELNKKGIFLRNRISLGKEKFCVLFGTVVTWVHTVVKMYQTLKLKSVPFILCKLFTHHTI